MRKFLLAGMLGVVFVAAPALAQEALGPAGGSVANLEPGFPTIVADTTTIDTGTFDVGVAGSYVTNGTVYEMALVQLRYGLRDNLQLSASWAAVMGEGLVRGNGDTALAVLWAPIAEDGNMPSMGVQAALRLPTGEGFTGYDATVVAAVTKTFKEARFHLNAGYTTVGDSGNGAPLRNDTDLIVLGMDYPVLDNLVLVVDAYSKEAPVKGGDRLEALEVGMRAALTDVDTVSAGVSLSIGNGNITPDFTAAVGYQRAL